MNKMNFLADSFYSKMDAQLLNRIFHAGFDYDKNICLSPDATLKARIKLLSKDKNFIPDEWEIVRLEYIEEGCSCICGHANIKNIYFLENIYTKHIVSIGKNCLENHFNNDTLDDLMDYIKHGTSISKKRYIWIAKKYDAFLLSFLGFKKTMTYSMHRKYKTIPNDNYIKTIKKKIKTDLKAFNAPIWSKRLERGKRLLNYIQNKHDYHKSHYPHLDSFIKETETYDVAKNGLYYGKKANIIVKDGIWRCQCGGSVTRWGSVGTEEKAWMKCNKCMNELIWEDLNTAPF